MASIRKTVVATGASSGLGFEAVKQLLQQSQPYRFILGARDLKATKSAYAGVSYDEKVHSVSILHLDLSNLKTVKDFAKESLKDLGQTKLDVLLLNAAMNKPAKGPGLHGSKWCEPYVVNHLSQHYLIHLFREKIVESKSKVVVVSSGLIRSVKEEQIENFDTSLKADSGTDGMSIYGATKFVQFLGAHWWRRQLGSSATVFTVSPGMVGGTGLGRHMEEAIDISKFPDALTVDQGGRNVVRAVENEDFPEDPNQIFFTSWGDWWPTEYYALSLDKSLQDKWSPSLEQIENDEGVGETSKTQL